MEGRKHQSPNPPILAIMTRESASSALTARSQTPNTKVIILILIGSLSVPRES
ncbi:uncharacterized protein METZ01_LOCUS314804 [marine metagenome]|uniref:Uncharacterized protein n=1 Tax=marine metagenome TaxID=408172 RepID=A0A382NMS9_9ZZZZ